MIILVVNGPNMNLLGTREPEIYGSITLKQIEQGLRKEYRNVRFLFFQSNHEGAIIDRLQKSLGEKADGIVLNPAALTHYSYAVSDAVAAMKVPVVEVHISNIHTREEFRRNSVIAEVCLAQVSGLGTRGYSVAVEMILEHLKSSGKLKLGKKKKTE
jgi:3-dehydroquinate dehydratase-2